MTPFTKTPIAVTMKSPISGEVNVMYMPTTSERIESWRTGDGNIQDVLPELNADQREFLMTGITAKEWDEQFPEEAKQYAEDMADVEAELRGQYDDYLDEQESLIDLNDNTYFE